MTFWQNNSAHLNSAYSCIARFSTPSVSRSILQDTLRKLEKAAKESTYICNQVAGFNRCLIKIQGSMFIQPKVIQGDQAKGKLLAKVQGATEELSLINFNQNVSLAMAKTNLHLSAFVFVQMTNITLAQHDAYVDHLKLGIKPETLAALRNAALHLACDLVS